MICGLQSDVEETISRSRSTFFISLAKKVCFVGGGGLVDLTGLLIAVDEFAEEGVDGHDWIWI